jgi:hypothetical protein
VTTQEKILSDRSKNTGLGGSKNSKQLLNSNFQMFKAEPLRISYFWTFGFVSSLEFRLPSPELFAF